MSKTTSSESQARIRKEQAEQQANLAKQKAERETAQAEQLDLFKSEIADNDRSMRTATEYLLKAVDLGATQRMAADKVGKSESWVNRLLKWGRDGFKDTGPFSTDAKAKRDRTAKNIRRLKKSAEDKRLGIGGNNPPADEPARVNGSADTEMSHEAATKRHEAPAGEETPPAAADGSIPSFSPPAEPTTPDDDALTPANGHAANEKPNDDRPLAEKLERLLNDVWSLCQDQLLPQLSNNKKGELRGAMKKLSEVREVLPRLATPSKSKLH